MMICAEPTCSDIAGGDLVTSKDATVTQPAPIHSDCPCQRLFRSTATAHHRQTSYAETGKDYRDAYGHRACHALAESYQVTLRENKSTTDEDLERLEDQGLDLWILLDIIVNKTATPSLSIPFNARQGTHLASCSAGVAFVIL